MTKKTAALKTQPAGITAKAEALLAIETRLEKTPNTPLNKTPNTTAETTAET